MIARSWPRPLAAVLMSLPALAVIAASLPGPVAGGEAKRSGRSTATGSSSSSGTVRSETRREQPGSTHYSYTVSDNAEWDGPAEVDAYAFSRDHGHWRNTSGSNRDWQDAEDAFDRTDGEGFWFRRGNDRYLVTDPAVIRKLAELFAPQEELGRRQGDLGRRQGELGRLQGELGRKQGQLGRIQAKLGLHQTSVSLEQSRRDRRGRDASDLEREKDEIEQRQQEAGDLQAELGEQQGILGERQAALGEQQAALGREQARVSKQITDALGRLTRELIADGRAERLGP
jgi:bla regulator protein blaR1